MPKVPLRRRETDSPSVTLADLAQELDAIRISLTLATDRLDKLCWRLHTKGVKDLPPLFDKDEIPF